MVKWIGPASAFALVALLTADARTSLCEDPPTSPLSLITLSATVMDEKCHIHGSQHPEDMDNPGAVKTFSLYDTDDEGGVIDRMAEVGGGRDLHVVHDRLMRHVEALPVDYCKLTDEHVDALGYLMGQYQKYRDDLLRLRADAKRFRVGLMEQVADTGLLPDGFADLEAEITYMRIRELRPEKVMELSPNCGWSTHYLLSALRDNGAGELHSYDLVDCSLKVLNAVSPDLVEGRWHFHQGDAFQSHLTKDTADSFDYFFIDSEHTFEFATRIIDTLFRTRRRDLPLRGGVHDSYNNNDKPSSEFQAFLEFFAGQSGERRMFTASPYKSMPFYATIMRIREELGVSSGGAEDNVAPCKWTVCANGMVFFDLYR